jgi:hypothetical protein
MNSKQISILLGMTVALGAAALFVTNKRQATTEAYVSAAEAVGKPLFADLKSSINNVATIVQTKPDKAVVTVQKSGEDWVVADKANYPASTQEVRKLLMAMANAKTIEAKTQNKDNYNKLGVNDITEAGAQGVHYVIKDNTGKELASVIVGNTGAQRADNTATAYVRKTSDKQTWLVSGELKGPTDITAWLQRDIVNIDPNRVQSVEVKKHGATAPTLLQKKARTDSNYDVGAIPEGKDLEADKPSLIASALANLQLDDVAPEKDITAPAEINTTVYKTFDGVVITATTFKANDKNWLKLAANYDEALATQFAPPPAAEPAKTETGDAAKPTKGSPTADATDQNTATPKPEDLKKEVETLNQRAAGWLFAIAPFKLDNLTLTLEGMLKDKAKPEAAAAGAEAPGGSANDKLKAELGQ